jgi:hypothetical protein
VPVARVALWPRRAINRESEAVSTRDAPPPAPNPRSLRCSSRRDVLGL